jgi:hypothetical protein
MAINILFAFAVSTIAQFSPYDSAGAQTAHYADEDIIFQYSNTYVGIIEAEYSPKIPSVNVILRNGHNNFTSMASVRTIFGRVLTRVSNDLDDIALSNSNRAIEDAIQFFSYVDLKHKPWASVSDEGIAMLQWTNGERGVMLFFGGDKIVTMSTADSTTNYSETMSDYRIEIDQLVDISRAIDYLYS